MPSQNYGRQRIVCPLCSVSFGIGPNGLNSRRHWNPSTHVKCTYQGPGTSNQQYLSQPTPFNYDIANDSMSSTNRNNPIANPNENYNNTIHTNNNTNNDDAYPHPDDEIGNANTINQTIIPPNIFYPKKKEGKVRDWATRMRMKCNHLAQVWRDKNIDDLDEAIIAFYDYHHPMARKCITSPTMISPEDDIDDLIDDTFLAVESVPIAQNNQTKILWKAVRNGNISKARKALSSNGVGDILSKNLRTQLASKYPTDERPPHMQAIPPCVQEDSGIDFINDPELYKEVSKYVFTFKRGQSPSALGWTMDFIQDLLFYEPDSIDGLLVLVQCILHGKLSDETRKKILLGRGVPLTELMPDGQIKQRPITIEDPIHKIASHILSSRSMPLATGVCGPFQLGNAIKGGAEVLVWTVRCLLELNPQFVIAQLDSNNAFNSPYHSTLMKTTNDMLPSASSYLATLLRAPLEVDYSNYQKKLCMRLSMHRGVPQGNPMSGIFFNVARKPALELLRVQHPNVFIISYHDDDYFIGLPADVFAAIDTFDGVMEPIGITRNKIKSKIYDPVSRIEDVPDFRQACARVGCAYIPVDDGILVCGSPVGSTAFMKSYVDRVVADGIKNQLENMKRAHLTPNGQVKREYQTIYQIVRMCVPSQLTYLFRTCAPDVTENAAALLDKLVTDFLILMFDCKSYSDGLSPEEKGVFLKRIHLKLSKGGLGITPSCAIIGAAFVGSITLCFQYVSSLVPSLVENWSDGNNRIYNLFIRHLDDAKQLCPHLANITLESMSTQSFVHIQKTITAGVQKLLEDVVDRSMQQGRPVGGSQMFYAQLDAWSQEKAIQHMANKDPLNYAFLSANPCAPLCGMSNSAFATAVQHRLLVPIGNQWNRCMCTHEVAPFFSHCYKCPHTRNKVRNALHKELKQSFEDIIKSRIEKANLSCRVLAGEPRLEDYFNPRQPGPEVPPDPPDPPDTTLSQYDRRGHEGGRKVRADMAIRLQDPSEVMVVDFTIADPTSHDHIRGYSKVGHAAKNAKQAKLRNEYKDWMVEINNQITKNFKIIAFESFGVGVSEDIKSLFSHFIHEEEDPIVVMQQINQQISVALHVLRASAFNRIVQQGLVSRRLRGV